MTQLLLALELYQSRGREYTEWMTRALSAGQTTHAADDLGHPSASADIVAPSELPPTLSRLLMLRTPTYSALLVCVSIIRNSTGTRGAHHTGRNGGTAPSPDRLRRMGRIRVLYPVPSTSFYHSCHQFLAVPRTTTPISDCFTRQEAPII